VEAIIVNFDRPEISSVFNSTWDVVIIGAGPAGAMAACSLGDRGLRVLLVDRQSFPRKKVCGGCLSAAAVQLLAQSGIDSNIKSLGAEPVNRMDLRCGSAGFGFDLPPGLAITRAALDSALSEAAVQRGATFLDSVSASLGDVSPKGDTRTVCFTDRGQNLGTVASPVVIVASGLNRSCLPGNNEFEQHMTRHSRMGLGTTIDCQDDNYPPGQIHMAIGIGGYVGLARVEDGKLNVAAALDASYLRSCGDSSQATGRLLDQCGYPDVEQLATAHWQGTAPLTTRILRPVGQRVFILGDAAGYVEPFTGEGMTWALATGAAIAPLAQRAQSSWNTSIEQEWLDLYRRLIQRRQRSCKTLAWLLRRPRLTRLTLRAARPLSLITRRIITRINQPIRHAPSTNRANISSPPLMSIDREFS